MIETLRSFKWFSGDSLTIFCAIFQAPTIVTLVTISMGLVIVILAIIWAIVTRHLRGKWRGRPLWNYMVRKNKGFCSDGEVFELWIQVHCIVVFHCGRRSCTNASAMNSLMIEGPE